MSNLKRVAKHLSLGGIVTNLGSGAAILTKVTSTGCGLVSSAMVADQKAKVESKLKWDARGSSLGNSVKETSAVLGDGINKTVRDVSLFGGHLSGKVAKHLGASEENIAASEKIGVVASGIVIGGVFGFGIADAAVAFGAVAGTVGGAAATSGLAALGGGSLAAGGGGMITGHAVFSSIVSAGCVSGCSSLATPPSEET